MSVASVVFGDWSADVTLKIALACPAPHKEDGSMI